MTESEIKLTIKPLSAEDVSFAAEVERISLGDEAWSAQGILDTMARNGHYLAAYIDDQFVGHGGFTSVLDEGYITNIAVHPNHRRKGIALRLTEALKLEGEKLELSFLTLEVRESNLAAIKLYEKAGFKSVGKRKGFYSNPKEDAVLMTLNFKKEDI
ncbi:MAG: ribosomal protein S18-alanine N-acetyltransferase [Clostridia bacterium]|nr:ribosomal protein S18-alanine N-acetyltransferase [Clostridia bacterium]